MNVLAIVVAMFATIGAIYTLRPLAISIGLVDKPNQQRKHHRGEVPLIGGVAMLLGFVIASLINPIDFAALKYLILCLVVIVAVGLLDDYRDLSVSFRFLFQGVIGLIMSLLAGVSVDSVGNLFGSGAGSLAAWSIPLTIFASIGAMNALNMVDGIDGLAGGLSMVTFSAVAWFAYLAGNPYLLQISLLLIAVLIPYLVVNIGLGVSSDKKIFLGDSGSMLLGLAVAWLLASLSQGEQPAFRPVTALWLFAVPLMDTVAIMFRRLLKGNSPFKPDREHLHHLLVQKGYSLSKSLLFIISLATIFALSGVILEMLQIAEWLMFVLFMQAFVIYMATMMLAWKSIHD
jgi:UDP-GlcNAc:undecaprenyl-phosphate GlcNAc-1-phosphate transferase